MIIIGEKINGTREQVAKAIKSRDAGFIKELAVHQTKAGADFLDVNAGTHPSQEPEDMTWLVQTIQESCDTRLCLDSANPKALLAGIKACKTLPMLNSLSGEQNRVEGVLPLAIEYKTELVVLALDDNGIPKTAEQRLDIVRRLIAMTREGGISDDKLYVDPLVTTIATDNNSGLTAFETIRRIRSEFPEAHITCGLSNISFGQPSRTIINQAFASLAIGAGMDSAIVDPMESGLRNSVYSAEMVMGMDPDCLNYNQAHRSGLIGKSKGLEVSNKKEIEKALCSLSAALSKAGIIDGQVTLQDSVQEEDLIHEDPDSSDVLKTFVDALVNMKKNDVMALGEEMLSSGREPLDLLEGAKQAMEEVGKLFEQGEYFVPELILSGKMLKDISEMVKPYLKQESEDDDKKGRVIIGTVEGDIHDIGKDIVVTMLEVNGYDVLDLGVDVPVARFVEAAQEFKPQVIGLSGFLTLAYDPMKESIAAIKAACSKDIKFMIGGGQIDEHIREYTGADAFGRDAVEAVKLCEEWFSAGDKAIAA
ncbi:hypothetical protein DSCA_50520 [Desulfosarcina alkanivorans]|uniref:Methionine synthase n=1 Tax=Desulfosarcina alkanivorans TaxID=571177 RepID=A0A5K7YMX9_9BACT|nr:dihydropteroate synthase [Desulfosarcina alkanivorans]BBO71122.1 hypothetical protein DSCA_50520 [Desulfosarcina alkanivorans]